MIKFSNLLPWDNFNYKGKLYFKSIRGCAINKNDGTKLNIDGDELVQLL